MCGRALRHGTQTSGAFVYPAGPPQHPAFFRLHTWSAALTSAALCTQRPPLHPQRGPAGGEDELGLSACDDRGEMSLNEGQWRGCERLVIETEGHRVQNVKSGCGCRGKHFWIGDGVRVGGGDRGRQFNDGPQRQA